LAQFLALQTGNGGGAANGNVQPKTGCRTLTARTDAGRNSATITKIVTAI